MRLRTSIIIGMCSITLFGCTMPWKNSKPEPVSGARSALFNTDILTIDSAKDVVIRRSALLGVYIADYLSTVSDIDSQGAITAIAAQNMMMVGQETVRDPDYELLQALQDALEVDVSDMLNRSDNREQALDTYSDAMTNVATRANDRYHDLAAAQKELDTNLRALNKERSTADRDVKKALKDKDFTKAQDLQKILLEKQSAYADIDLKKKQVDDVVKTLDVLLNLYGQKILAIQKNREALIAGIKLVDVPGIDQLKLIDRVKTKNTNTKGSFDSLFEGSGLK